MKPACPKCHAVVSFDAHGGLFSIRCASCGWLEEGTCNQELFPSIPSQVFVAKGNAPVSAAALKVIRDEHAPARYISLNALRSELSSETGLWVGCVPQYKHGNLVAKLSAVGIRLEAVQHEEG